MEKYDHKRVFKHLYAPKGEPSVVTVPLCTYFVVAGEGSPLGEAYDEAVKLLYTLSYTLKKAFKEEKWYQGFVVAPLEGVWSAIEVENRDSWQWKSMIAQPPFVTDAIFTKVVEQCSFTEGISVKKARLEQVEEGLCVTMMHIGPYAYENRSFEKMDRFCLANKLERLDETHHEIYLSNPNKTAPEHLKTVLRYRVGRV